MKKAISLILALGLTFGIAGPAMGESRLVAPGGISQGTADGLYGSLAGESAWAGTQSFALATLIAKAATADTHVVNRLFGDGRYFPFSGGTITGNFLVDGNTTLGNASLDTVRSNAANWEFPNATTTFDNAGKFIQLLGGLKVNAASTFFSNFTVEGSTTLGDVVGDSVTSHAGFWIFRNATDMQFDAALILDATGFPVTCNGTSWTFAGNVFIDGDITVNGDDFSFGNDKADTVYFGAGTINFNADPTEVNFNGDTTIDFTGKNVGCKGPLWDFATGTTDVTVPDANAATEAMNQQTSDARYVQTRSPIVVMFGAGTDPYFSTSNAAYTTAGVFLFGGTNDFGTPTSATAIGFKEVNPTFWDWRLLDITNATTIAEVTGNTGIAPEISTDGTLTNLPAAQAIFEYQIKRAGGIVADNVFTHSLNIEF